MKRISRKVSAAIRLLKASGLHRFTGDILAQLITRLYRIADKRKGQQTRSLSLAELETYLRELGVGDGSTLLVHSSWDGVKGSEFKPLDLIELLQKLVGQSGTIAMPSYTALPMEDGVCFDVDRAASSAGWITEVFRRMPGVIRSANVSHPVCASGPQAGYLVDQHHLGASPWDEFSPYFRIGSVRDSWIVGIGVGHGLRVTTSLHCVESVLSDHQYFKKLFHKEIAYSFVSERLGSGAGRVKVASSVIFPAKILRFFKNSLSEASLSGVEVYAIRARDLLDKALEIGVSGRVMHIWPIPWSWFFTANRRSARMFTMKILNKAPMPRD